MRQNDKKIIRELAKQYMEMALSERQKKMFERMRDTNDLKLVRPPLLIDEIPWYQMDIDGELALQCQDERAQRLETHLRQSLYRWKYFAADTFFEPFYRITMSYDSTGIGWDAEEKILRTDGTNNIVSHQYADILEDESALEKFHLPEFTLRPDKDEAAVNYYTDLLGDVMPVKLCGRGYIYFSPWDKIASYRGMEAILLDLYDRPEYLHEIMKRMIAAMLCEMDFIEKYSHVDPTSPKLHCTPALISGLAEDGLKATWFRVMAQGFGSVSPQMHEEFDIEYLKPLAERFAYTYYGCCEPLDRKMGVITKIKNLRKIGVSPWADVESMAEQIGGKYVFSRKPNPANVALVTDPEVIRKEIEQTVKACIKNGCPCDITLKDISTVSNRPENLIVWAKTASEVLDEYYGK